MKKLITALVLVPSLLIAQVVPAAAPVIAAAAPVAGGWLSWLPGGWESILALVVGFNVLLAAVKKILDLIPAASGIDSFLGVLISWIQKVIDLFGGNVEHK